MKGLIIGILLGLFIAGVVIGIGIPTYNNYQDDKAKILENATIQGYEYALATLSTKLGNCEIVKIVKDEKELNVVAVECIQKSQEQNK